MKKTYLIIGLIIVLVLAVAGAYYFSSRNNDADMEKDIKNMLNQKIIASSLQDKLSVENVTLEKDYFLLIRIRSPVANNLSEAKKLSEELSPVIEDMANSILKSYPEYYGVNGTSSVRIYGSGVIGDWGIERGRAALLVY